MIAAIAALLVLQLVGTVIVRLTGLPLPGPVLGMLLLFCYLLVRGEPSAEFAATTRTLLGNLALLFVPAGVGIVTHLRDVADQWLALSITLVASTAIAIVVTAFVLRWLMAGHDDHEQAS